MPRSRLKITNRTDSHSEERFQSSLGPDFESSVSPSASPSPLSLSLTLPLRFCYLLRSCYAPADAAHAAADAADAAAEAAADAAADDAVDDAGADAATVDAAADAAAAYTAVPCPLYGRYDTMQISFRLVSILGSLKQ